MSWPSEITLWDAAIHFATNCIECLQPIVRPPCDLETSGRFDDIFPTAGRGGFQNFRRRSDPNRPRLVPLNGKTAHISVGMFHHPVALRVPSFDALPQVNGLVEARTA
jgi:hypothetical protein